MYHSTGDHVGYVEKKDPVKETTNSRGGSVRRGIMKRFAIYFNSLSPPPLCETMNT